MAALPIDITSSQWAALKVYCIERIEQLTEECIGIGSTNEQRSTAAARIDELRDLLNAPVKTSQRTQHMKAYTPHEGY